MNISEGVILGQIRIGMLAYADDIALLGEHLDIIKRLGSNLINAAKKVSLTVNEEKQSTLWLAEEIEMAVGNNIS